MSTHIHIVDGPIGGDIGREAATGDGTAGAVLMFDGVVRELEDGRRLRGLEYEAYEPMASRELARLAAEVVAAHTLIALECWHSRGLVAVGECSMRVVVRSGHRAAALAAMGEFIDRLKKDVPIWKTPVWME
jgi:molybdopterin synthase catalytic subunit